MMTSYRNANVPPRALDNIDLGRLSPSIFTNQPHHKVSDQYTFLPTLDVVNMMRDMGWHPTKAQEIRVQPASDRAGYQKHLVRFQRPDLRSGEEAIEAVLINSHDRTTAYQFLLGVWRFICANGMMVGDTWDGIRVRHIGSHDDIRDASRKMIQEAPNVIHKIQKWRAIPMTQDEQGMFAAAALELTWDREKREGRPPPVEPRALLTTRRCSDLDRTNSLWGTMNVVQENLIKGGLRGRSANGKRVRTRAVKSLDRDVRLNRALWMLTEHMAGLKDGTIVT